MNNTDIFFSVIIPTRNRPKEFHKALKSVLSQTYNLYEIIVVNDGSSFDNKQSYEAIKKYCPNSVHFIDLIERPKGHGHCFARNQAAEIASGRFICFLDDDDWWIDNEFLERAAHEINAHDADFYFSNQKAITEDGQHIKNVWVEDLPNALTQNDLRLQNIVYPVTIVEILSCSGFPHMNCWAISKKLYQQIGGMDENLRYEPDRDIFMRALDNSSCVLYDTTITALHNIPNQTKKNNASTLNNKLDKLLFQLRTIDKGILFLQHPALIEFCKTGKGYIVKNIAIELYNQNKYSQALHYSLQGLAAKPTMPWLFKIFSILYREILNKK